MFQRQELCFLTKQPWPSAQWRTRRCRNPWTCQTTAPSPSSASPGWCCRAAHDTALSHCPPLHKLHSSQHTGSFQGEETSRTREVLHAPSDNDLTKQTLPDPHCSRVEKPHSWWPHTSHTELLEDLNRRLTRPSACWRQQNETKQKNKRPIDFAQLKLKENFSVRQDSKTHILLNGRMN